MRACLAVYFYVVATLAVFGFMSYLGIPSTYIQSSLAGTIIYFFFLFKIGIALALTIQWWFWLLFVASLIGIAIFSTFDLKSLGKRILLASALLLLAFSFSFGQFMAKNQGTYLTPQEHCTALDVDKQYIIPFIDEHTILFIPVEKTPYGKKISGGFFQKDPSQFSCEMSYKNVGKIEK